MCVAVLIYIYINIILLSGKKEREFWLSLQATASSSVGAFAGCGWRWLPPGLPVEQPLVAAAGAWQLTLILTAASLFGHHGYG